MVWTGPIGIQFVVVVEFTIEILYCRIEYHTLFDGKVYSLLYMEYIKYVIDDWALFFKCAYREHSSCGIDWIIDWLQGFFCSLQISLFDERKRICVPNLESAAIYARELYSIFQCRMCIHIFIYAEPLSWSWKIKKNNSRKLPREEYSWIWNEVDSMRFAVLCIQACLNHRTFKVKNYRWAQAALKF